MNTVAPTFRSEPREIDVRCSAALPGKVRAEGRCQLFAGHDGPHAIMFARGFERRLRLWSKREPGAAVEAGISALQRPWMFGFPAPAWFEADEPASLGS